VKALLDTIQFLYRDIKGRRENLAPVFVIGGRYVRKNPFFENRIVLHKGRIQVNTLTEILTGSDDIKEHTIAGVTSGIFENDSEVKKELGAGTVAEAFKQLKKEVDEYYGESD
jgi:CRISPR-associated protein Cst2